MDKIRRISAIPLNTEKFKSIRINNVDLKDSMSLLDGSLDQLVETLKRSHHDFPLMKKVFPVEKQRELLIGKGYYPYEWVQSIEQLQNQTSLPAHEHFYSKLALKNISKEEYEHAQKVWAVCECKNMLDYTRIYVACDTVLLAEVVQTFRRKIFDEFKLDASQFLSLPGLAKEIMLKISDCELDMIDQSSMCYFFKSGIRGGVSYVNNRHVDLDDLEKKTGEKFALLYLDCNRCV